MLCLPLLLAILTHNVRSAYVTNTPSFADKLDRLYEKLERLTVPPVETNVPKTRASPEEKLYAKLDKLNSLTPDKELTDDDEELLSAMQLWGSMSGDQLTGMMKELQSMKMEEYEKSERLTDQDYVESDWNDDEPDDYTADGPDDWDPDEEPDSSTSKPMIAGVTPSAITRLDMGYRQTVLSAIDPIAATNERPKILDDTSLTSVDKSTLRLAALNNMRSVIRAGKCLTPQPRWLSVRQLAPAADTVYMPPCVQLHRCAADSGCCFSEAEVCAPVDGKFITIPFYLNKADGNITVARMQFFNHTRCACVSRETLQSTVRTRIDSAPSPQNDSVDNRVSHDLHDSHERRYNNRRENHDSQEREKYVQSEWRAPTEEPKLERDEEQTAPPQLRRCTCPHLFQARISENGVCSCVCDWPDAIRRRDCLSFARGREHFALKARVCVINGDCTAPTCEYGVYERNTGRCPLRRFRRIRYHTRRFQPEKTQVV